MEGNWLIKIHLENSQWWWHCGGAGMFVFVLTDLTS